MHAAYQRPGSSQGEREITSSRAAPSSESRTWTKPFNYQIHVRNVGVLFPNLLSTTFQNFRPIQRTEATRELFGDDGAKIIDLFFLQSCQESNVMMDCELVFTEEDMASDGSDYAHSDQEDGETLNSEDYE